MRVPFNIPYNTGKESEFIKESIASGYLSGNGPFTERCHKLLEEIGYGKVLLTTSCTAALEMAAILAGIKPGDEVIVPAYTFVSTALAFSRQGAKIVFVDSKEDNPCLDVRKIENLISNKTKAIIPVHYNGIACEMDPLNQIAKKYGIYIIEDTAHAFGAKYKGKLLGTFGHFGCFSFHETKVIHCGEGGMLSVNDEKFIKRAEIIWEKGTNRCEFKRGEVKRYEWIDTGSSFLMSDINAAFLYDQILMSEQILKKRKNHWHLYYENLNDTFLHNFFQLPVIPTDCQINYAGFYIVTKNYEIREKLRTFLNNNGIQSVSHYLDLSMSPYIRTYQLTSESVENSNSLRYQDNLLRLPLYPSLANKEILQISELIKSFFTKDKIIFSKS